MNYLITKRKELNLSQKQVANRLNITQQHYSRIEKGLIDSTPYLNKLSKHLKCNKKELLSFQISKRGGEFKCIDNANRVTIIGKAKTRFKVSVSI